ncbi:Chromosome III, complete sequence, related [Eimeria maxima]|uniref:Chromosome III, complete sequence, related n=1 Tax=Eimeria maxima TaxID=5804 RepID=U6M4R6_EIMMA|nr:Chromosome III, complete sequence, related [Eimeria maxima]CDJ57449.1 Chromosome III, complete sequence, related [Eimeria maxima]
MLYGSEQLDPYIGKLKMAKLLEVLNQDDILNAAAEGGYGSTEVREGVVKAIDNEQTKREVLLALQLRDRVQPFVDGEGEEWKKKMKKEIKELCSVRNTFAVAKSVLQAAMAATDIQQRHQQKTKEETQKADDTPQNPNRLDTQDIDKVGEILQSVLSIVACDVEDTARKAAEKICRDESVSLEIRVLRAEALQWLGEEMAAAAAAAAAIKQKERFDVSRHMEDAFIKATIAADEKNR